MLHLKNGTYIDPETHEFTRTDLLVGEGVNGTLQQTGPRVELPGTTTLDCTGKFITHAFANGHHHVYSALARGMPAPPRSPTGFPEILELVWWRLDKALDTAMIRASALATAMACAKNGVAFVVDHHASPFSIKGSLETIASAFDEVGVGHLLCYEISDRDGAAVAEEGLQETGEYLETRHGLVGLHASFTVGERTLQRAVDLSEKYDTGIHIHVAEDLSDQDHCREKYGKRVVQRLSDAGVLDRPGTLLAHCLHLDGHEREMVAKSRAWVVENMESNLNNEVGLFRPDGLGDRIMLGTDGMHSDMLRSAKAAFFAGRRTDPMDYAGIFRRFRNVDRYLRETGIPGAGENNLVVLGYDSPTPLQPGNFTGHFLFGIESRHVCHVISRGRLILENQRLVNVNEEEILEECRLQSERLWRILS